MISLGPISVFNSIIKYSLHFLTLLLKLSESGKSGSIWFSNEKSNLKNHQSVTLHFPSKTNSGSNTHTRNQKCGLFFRSQWIVPHQHLHGRNLKGNSLSFQ